MKNPSYSNQLTQQILSHLFSIGAFAWRANTTGIWDPTLNAYRASAKKGVPDIICCYKGRFIAIEVKSPKDRLRPEQEGFLRSTEHAGGYAFVARSYDDYLTKFSTVDTLRSS